jgi:Helicase associated domain
MIRDSMKYTKKHGGNHRGLCNKQQPATDQRQIPPDKFSRYPDFPPTFPEEKQNSSRNIQHMTLRHYPCDYYHPQYHNMESFEAYPPSHQSVHDSRQDVTFTSDRDSEYHSRNRKRISSPIQISRSYRTEKYDFDDDTFYNIADTGDQYYTFPTIESSQEEDFGDSKLATKRRRQSIGSANHAFQAQHERTQSDNSLPYTYDNRYPWDNDSFLYYPSFNAPQNAPHGYLFEEYNAYPGEHAAINPTYPYQNTPITNNHPESTVDELLDYHEEDLTMTLESISKGSNAMHANEALTPPSPSLRTKGGERTSELKLHPSEQELDTLPNPRAKDALRVWYKRLGELVAFKNKYGHTNVRQKYPENPQLGIWVNKQRCTRETLTAEKLAALEAIDFDWGTKKGDHAWETKYRELIQYKAMNGNCKLETSSPSHSYFSS